MFWDDKIEYSIDSDLSIIETPNESLQLKAKAWKQPNRGGIYDMEKRRPVRQAVIQLDRQEVNQIGRIWLLRLRQAVKDLIAPMSNLPYWSRAGVRETERVKRLYGCTDEDILLCLTQVSTPLDRLKEVFAKAQTILQLNGGFSQVKTELGSASSEAISIKPEEPDK